MFNIYHNENEIIEKTWIHRDWKWNNRNNWKDVISPPASLCNNANKFFFFFFVIGENHIVNVSSQKTAFWKINQMKRHQDYTCHQDYTDLKFLGSAVNKFVDQSIWHQEPLACSFLCFYHPVQYNALINCQIWNTERDLED